MNTFPRFIAFAARCSLLGALLSPVAATAFTLPLQRGDTGTFSVEIWNATPTEIPLAVFEALRPPFAYDQYTLTVVESPLCELRVGSYDNTLLNAVELAAGPLPANAPIHCTIQVHRPSTSTMAMGLHFTPERSTPAGVTLTDGVWIFGPLTDLSIETVQIAPFPLPGEDTGVVRITIHNAGPWNVENVNFGYCQDTAFAPFGLDNALPGGCLEASAGPTCFSTGGPSVAFGMTAPAPGEARSCLLRATAHEPLSEPIRFGIQIVEGHFHFDGESPSDIGHANNYATLEIATSAGVGTSVATPVSSTGTLALIALFLLLGVLAIGRLAAHSRPT